MPARLDSLMGIMKNKVINCNDLLPESGWGWPFLQLSSHVDQELSLGGGKQGGDVEGSYMQGRGFIRGLVDGRGLNSWV